MDDRETALRRHHMERLEGMKLEVDNLLGRKQAYIDPDFALEPATGESLFKRASDERRLLLRDLPGVDLPEMDYEHPVGLGESLNREDLRRLHQDITRALRSIAN